MKHSPLPWMADEQDGPVLGIVPSNPGATRMSEEYNKCFLVARFYGPDAAENVKFVETLVNHHGETISLLREVEKFLPDTLRASTKALLNKLGDECV